MDSLVNPTPQIVDRVALGQSLRLRFLPIACRRPELGRAENVFQIGYGSSVGFPALGSYA